MATILLLLLEIIQKYLIKDISNIVNSYLEFTGYKYITTDIPHNPDVSNHNHLVLSPNNKLVAYATKYTIKIFDIFSSSSKLLKTKTIVADHIIDGINFEDDSLLVYVSNDGIITKYNLNHSTIDMTMMLKTNSYNIENISLVLWDFEKEIYDKKKDNKYVNAIVTPKNIVLNKLNEIVFNNKVYNIQNDDYGCNEKICLDKNNNLLVLKTKWKYSEHNLCYHSSICVCDTNSFKMIHECGKESRYKIKYVTVLKNNDIVTDSSVNIIIWRNYEILYTLIGHSSKIEDVVELESDNIHDVFLVSASFDRTLKFWKNSTLIKSISTDNYITKIVALNNSRLLCVTDNEIIMYS